MDQGFRRAAAFTGASQALERGRAQPWAVEDAQADYIGSMLGTIVGFAMPIQRVYGINKLSENKHARNLAGVQAGLQQSSRSTEQSLSARMADLTKRSVRVVHEHFEADFNAA